MGMVGRVEQVLWRGTPTTVVECRHCGSTLDIGSEWCPECGSNEVSRYEIE